VKAVVLVDGCAARRLVIGLKDAPVLGARAHRTLGDGAAKDRLRTPRRDVIRRERQSEGVGQIHIRAAFKVRKVAERGERPVERTRVRDAVPDPCVDEGRQDVKAMIEAVIPIICRMSSAQAFGGVTGWRRANERSPVIHRGPFP